MLLAPTVINLQAIQLRKKGDNMRRNLLRRPQRRFYNRTDPDNSKDSLELPDNLFRICIPFIAENIHDDPPLLLPHMEVLANSA